MSRTSISVVPHLALGIPSSIAAPFADSPSSVVIHGWLLKKRRKKLQGFAKRYFMLYQSGLLVYSFEPGLPVRDGISLPQAAISTAPGRKDIHIDSNTGTFHIKCLTTEDFQSWMLAFRKFLATGQETRRSMASSLRQVTRQGSVSLNKTGTIADEMGSTIADIENTVHALKNEATKENRKSASGKPEKDKKDSVFLLFKKPHSPPSMSSESSSESEPRKAIQQLQNSLEALKSQHARLLHALHEISAAEISQAHHSPLPLTKEEDGDEDEGKPGWEPSSPLHVFSPVPSGRHSKRSSVSTTMSDSMQEWFDAWDGEEPGAQEFVLDPDASQDDPQQPSRIIRNESHDTISDDDRSSIEVDIEKEELEEVTKSDLENEQSLNLAPLKRRTKLPAPVTGDEGSLFTILKKNVGKDLSTITFPVTFNEPLTLLQRAAEEVEYFDLLTKAAEAKDSVERLAYVTAFAVSGYAHTRYRSSRKGFNPMLAETFEDERMKFIAEKTCHNPVEMAYHAEGAGWELNATSAGKTKFWGKSLEIIPLGTTHLQIGSDRYQWKKPSSFMRNLMVGTKYLEHCGNMTIENVSDGSNCVCEFKQSSYWGSGLNVIAATLYSPAGKQVARLEGKWDEQISLTLDSDNFRVLWRAAPPPRDYEDYYGFTSFGITLNETVGDMSAKLPPTDSRLRTDVRALEEGRLDEAEAEKSRIEELQRDRRRKGVDAQPKWFKKVGDDWQYIGGYWEQREKGWKDAEVEALW